jgi:hypothetical protein
MIDNLDLCFPPLIIGKNSFKFTHSTNTSFINQLLPYPPIVFAIISFVLYLCLDKSMDNLFFKGSH